MTRIASLFLAAALGFGATKPIATGSGANTITKVDARLLLERPAIKEVLGQDPGDNVVVVEVTLTPAQGKKLNIVLDDFLMRSDRDGQKSQPYAPSQIGGSTVMVISSTGGQQGTGMSEQRRVPYGIPGIPGTGGGPGPTLPGNQPPTGGVATADTSSANASIDEETGRTNDSPLLTALKEKILPEKEIQEPTKGLLYFVFEGKQKVKDFELLYKTSAGRVSVRFKEPK